MSVLRGEEPQTDGEIQDGLDGNPLAAVNVHVTGALAAAVFDDAAELDRHTAAAVPLLPFVESTYLTSTAYLLGPLLWPAGARAVGPETRGVVLAELDAIIDWLAARTSDAPFNFRHLLRLVEAERAWAAGEFRTAASTFDAAVRECLARQRPWHRALAFERAARFLLSNGIEHAGYDRARRRATGVPRVGRDGEGGPT